MDIHDYRPETVLLLSKCKAMLIYFKYGKNYKVKCDTRMKH